MATTNGEGTDPTLHLPRILCLHGGGVTAAAFRLQSRTLLFQLKPYFRLVFADAPFICDAGPGILPVYADYAPFRRWLRWLPEHAAVNRESAIDEIWDQLRLAMDEDNNEGATGDWVGLLGFSQGGKMSASLLFDQQVREELGVNIGPHQTDWRFAVLMAARAPLVSLSEYSTEIKGLQDPENISEGFENLDDPDGKCKLRLPTIHVHGLKDGGLHLHRRLLEQYCEPGSTTVIEWDGNHRVPIKTNDVKQIVDAILDVAQETGILTAKQILEAQE